MVPISRRKNNHIKIDVHGSENVVYYSLEILLKRCTLNYRGMDYTHCSKIMISGSLPNVTWELIMKDKSSGPTPEKLDQKLDYGVP